MATKTDRMEARVSPEQRETIERAASASGLSVSAFMVGAAVERADDVLAELTTTIVPADYFDALVGSLDAPDASPQLAKAATKAQRDSRIEAG